MPSIKKTAYSKILRLVTQQKSISLNLGKKSWGKSARKVIFIQIDKLN